MNPIAKILIIEDSYFNQILVESLVSSWGYDTQTCSRADNGLETLATDSTIKLVILDLMLPGMDGFEFLAKKRELGSDVPVIVLSAKSDGESIRRVQELGAVEYLNKPLNTGVLKTKITNYLNQ
ncbi:MAG: response regulator [Tenuifilaceae bacterium]|jgi:DNA-binding response OmpR family regulator|nr:response regulator [Tenuifilaceae bacterium]